MPPKRQMYKGVHPRKHGKGNMERIVHTTGNTQALRIPLVPIPCFKEEDNKFPMLRSTYQNNVDPVCMSKQKKLCKVLSMYIGQMMNQG